MPPRRSSRPPKPKRGSEMELSQTNHPSVEKQPRCDATVSLREQIRECIREEVPEIVRSVITELRSEVQSAGPSSQTSPEVSNERICVDSVPEQMADSLQTPNQMAVATILDESPASTNRRVSEHQPQHERKSDSSSTPPADNLTNIAASLLQKSLASSTQATYQRAYQHFLSFFKQRFSKEEISPATIKIEHLLLYIAFCFQQNLAFATINTQISGLSFLAKMSGGSGFSDNFVIRKALQGYEKSKKSVDSRLPITPSILKLLVESLPYTCNSHFGRTTLKAMYLLAFHAFLRIGELTGTKNNSTNCIKRENVSFVHSLKEVTQVHLRITNFKSSTGKHTPTLVIQANPHTDLCPVNALTAYCKMRGHSEGPLFSLMDGSPITRHFFTQELQNSLKWAGLDYSKFKGHSFRIGAATSAASMGIGDQSIQLMGRWHSDAFRKYIRIPALTLPRGQS